MCNGESRQMTKYPYHNKCNVGYRPGTGELLLLLAIITAWEELPLGSFFADLDIHPICDSRAPAPATHAHGYVRTFVRIPQIGLHACKHSSGKNGLCGSIALTFHGPGEREQTWTRDCPFPQERNKVGPGTAPFRHPYKRCVCASWEVSAVCMSRWLCG